MVGDKQNGKTKQEKSFYRLFNFSNGLVLEGEIETLKNINVSNLKKGQYILKIISGKNSETHHIIID
ncbi:T9SS type A sorting domain-containing protein [Aureibaculum sp. 2210JD6-5]|uniref:T9SS type A sorting domain-containing protein n=1 Tax=Aureibaculum sp. 2210JD6-5 TaxID=3103957 RepID=UPI0039F18E7B